MLISISSLTAIGAGLGLVLGMANRFLPVEDDPIVERITDMMPGTQCGQCGYAGCRPAAAALVASEAPVTLCPPGGAPLVRLLAEALDRPIGDDLGAASLPSIAVVDTSCCIGCTRCLKDCPTDALVGGAKQIHVVLEGDCTGCGACVDVCPTECIHMEEIPTTLGNWRWPKPVQGPHLIAKA